MVIRYRASKHDCDGCSLKPRCCPGQPARKVPRSIHEGARDMARDLALFDRFDASLRERGYLAMAGQIVDATVIEARRPRLKAAEKATLREGGTPPGWSKARARQIDRDGRWTIKRGKKAPPPSPGQVRRVEIATPMFGYKNRIGIDRAHGLVRRFVVPSAGIPPANAGGTLAAPPTPRVMTAVSSARCSIRTTPPPTSGPTRRTAARPTWR